MTPERLQKVNRLHREKTRYFLNYITERLQDLSAINPKAQELQELIQDLYNGAAHRLQSFTEDNAGQEA
jgi:GR25 family glycosyltransferase involved in LPS biosynthesis